MGQQKRKKKFNDLLLPIILVIAVLPFVVRLISYDTGLSNYSWNSDFDVVHDFFSYYKSCAFLFVSFASFIIIIPYILLKKSSIKSMRSSLFLGIFAVLAIISTIFSVQSKSSITGGMEHFENIFILLGYLIMLIYTYQMEKKEEDYRSILKAFLISLAIIGIIGSFQMIGMDLLYNRWIQKLVIPHTDWMAYIGNMKSYLSNNAVSLTLFNPNFTSVYLAMVIPFLITLLLPDSDKFEHKKPKILSERERIGISILIVLLTILLFKTYSRTGLLALAVSLIVLAIFHGMLLICRWKQCIIIMICSILLFTVIDSFNDFRYMKKLKGTIKSFGDDQEIPTLDEILTKEQGVFIVMEGEGITVSITGDDDSSASLIFNASGKDITDSYNTESNHLMMNNFENVSFRIQNLEGKDYIFCEINKITWKFYQDETDGYIYINDFGKRDHLIKIEQFGIKGLEDIGSGRGYIWSRTIPIVKDTLLIGTGPDTFLYVFPQSDYVGKANNCKTPVTLIERPHNMYLMTGVQTGMISLIALIAFYLIYLLQSIRIYKRITLSSLKERMGFGCFIATVSFMVSGFFNDSSIQTTPLFVVMLGLGMDINYQIKGNHGIK